MLQDDDKKTTAPLKSLKIKYFIKYKEQEYYDSKRY